MRLSGMRSTEKGSQRGGETSGQVNTQTNGKASRLTSRQVSQKRNRRGIGGPMSNRMDARAWGARREKRKYIDKSTGRRNTIYMGSVPISCRCDNAWILILDTLIK